MAVKPSTRRELYKLRELVHFLLYGAGASRRDGATGRVLCFFCDRPLLDDDFVAHGNASGPRFAGDGTIHHVDGDHENNDMANKALCHRTCHKAFHLRENRAGKSQRL